MKVKARPAGSFLTIDEAMKSVVTFNNKEEMMKSAEEIDRMDGSTEPMYCEFYAKEDERIGWKNIYIVGGESPIYFATFIDD